MTADWLEGAYEERYENDLEEWETEQVYRDREHEVDEDLDDECLCDPHDPGNADGCEHERPYEPPPMGNCLPDPPPPADPNPLGADIPTVEEELVYGGEGHGNADARQLVCIQPLADRSALSHKERIIVLDSDVRDAMMFARARLDAEAMKYSAQGFTWDLDDIVYDHGGRRIVTATLRIARNGA